MTWTVVEDAKYACNEICKLTDLKKIPIVIYSQKNKIFQPLFLPNCAFKELTFELHYLYSHKSATSSDFRNILPCTVTALPMEVRVKDTLSFLEFSFQNHPKQLLLLISVTSLCLLPIAS